MTVETENAAAAEGEWTAPTVEVEVGGSSPDDALIWASKYAAQEPFIAQVGFLLQHVGPRVVWTSLGLRDPRMLTKWLDGGEPKSDVTVTRVHLLFQACYAITAVFDGATAARFLRVHSPFLGYVAPGDLLRTNPPGEVAQSFLGAAQHFLTA